MQDGVEILINEILGFYVEAVEGWETEKGRDGILFNQAAYLERVEDFKRRVANWRSRARRIQSELLAPSEVSAPTGARTFAEAAKTSVVPVPIKQDPSTPVLQVPQASSVKTCKVCGTSVSKKEAKLYKKAVGRVLCGQCYERLSVERG